MTLRRSVLAALVLAAAFWAGCTSPPEGPGAREREVLAPTGKLRVGVYAGSPTSLVKGASGEARGVSVEIGRQFAQRLGVPYEQVEFPRLAAVLDALKAGQVDFTITNATPARAADMNFSAPLVELELGYLVMPGARVRALADVDQPGIKVGVSQGSSSQAALTRQFTHAQVVPAPSLKAAAEMLSKAQIDTFATNKAILFEMADGLPGAKVLDGRWGVEQLAIAIPKGREEAMPFVRRFAEDVKADGSVQRAAERAGLRGTVTVR
ncbi:MAG: transporter substrate-binding domain-containing protein [Burkholderiaceae bacterium]|jgi:polar amino acid transport system substrate-binding protein|nr:transporter substrate-binding domain-containing protein [Burkholderiaceae bacterium]MCU0963528.1 transporter substrate-binding domain-containing protein [Burkholderiaceae bacterium]